MDIIKLYFLNDLIYLEIGDGASKSACQLFSLVGIIVINDVQVGVINKML